jgi:hypothetical protein
MTTPPDRDLAPPKDPAEYRPRPLLGFGFWALLLFGVVCVVAGVLLALYGPKLLAHRPPQHFREAPVAEPARPVTPAALSDAAPPPPAPEAAPAPEVAALSARVSALEAQAARTNHAAAAALAAAALVEASQGSRPFPEEAAALRAVSAGSPDLDQLARLAGGGAPSRASLTASFPDYAARAASAARRPGEGAPIGDRIAYVLSKVVMVRRVGEVDGDGPDAQLARAEQFVEDGDYDRAFTALDRMPPAARDAMSAWRVRAERRAEIDRLAATLRARALADLAAAGRSGA